LNRQVRGRSQRAAPGRLTGTLHSKGHGGTGCGTAPHRVILRSPALQDDEGSLYLPEWRRLLSSSSVVLPIAIRGSVGRGGGESCSHPLASVSCSPGPHPQFLNPGPVCHAGGGVSPRSGVQSHRVERWRFPDRAIGDSVGHGGTGCGTAPQCVILRSPALQDDEGSPHSPDSGSAARPSRATRVRAGAPAQIPSLLRGESDFGTREIGEAVTQARDGPRPAGEVLMHEQPPSYGPQAGEGCLPLVRPRHFSKLTFPSPAGRGWTVAGAFTSRSGTGEGSLAPVSLRHSSQKPSRVHEEPPIDDTGECRGTYEGAESARFGKSLFVSRCRAAPPCRLCGKAGPFRAEPFVLFFW
jgi:hypothetical protein